MAAAERHDTLETAQLVVAIATGLVGLFYYQRHKSRAGEEAPQLASVPTGPAGFGEVAGGGGGAFSSTPVNPVTGPKPPAGGEQSGTIGSEEPAKVISEPRYPGEGQKFGPNPEGPAPGEGQAEWERNRRDYEHTHARPLAGRPPVGAAGLGVVVARRLEAVPA